MDDDEPFCYTCVSSAHWVECESCDQGYALADWDGYIGEYIEDCQVCNGMGGWWICLGSEHHDLDLGSIHRIPLDERVASVN